MPSAYLFSSGLSALRAQSAKFDTIRSNIENQSVPGYKAADVRFKDLVVSGEDGRTEQLNGARAFQQVFISKEGDYITTGKDFDGAIAGSGFYVTRTSFDNSGDIELTDSGAFNETLVDVDGEERVFLTDVKGNFLLGYNADTATGDLTVDLSGVGALSPIDVTRSTALSVANATTTLAVLGNLAPDTAVGANETFSFTVLDGTGDADELADERLVTLDFTKTGNNAWDMTISAENGTVSAPAVQPVPVTFDANGQLVSLNGSTTPTQDFTVDWTGPVVSTPINLGLAGFTQVSAPSAISRVNVNGNSDGFLREVAFGQNGQVIGSFSNGIARPIGQVALGDVVAPERMAVLNGNHYRITQNSGELALYDFTDTTRATFQPGALERSTTNLTQEFTNLIVTQRAYSSAATTIRTVDEMMQTATNLKN